jgi:hypothetical protein
MGPTTAAHWVEIAPGSQARALCVENIASEIFFLRDGAMGEWEPVRKSGC